MKLKHISRPFKLKEVDETGRFSGYGSVFDVVDHDDEIVVRGAFTESLKVRRPAMLWQHRSAEPLGVFTRYEEDAVGLALEGQLALKTQRGAEAYELLKMDALGGLSIGYISRDDSYDRATGVRTLKQLDLWETSLVTFPSNESARVTDVKSIIEGGALPSLKEFEVFLREAGFSKSQAAAIAGKGLAQLLRSESASNPSGDDLDAVLGAIRSFRANAS